MAGCAPTGPLVTARYLHVDIVGTEEAFCRLYTQRNRYELRAPGKALVERSSRDLTVDCQDMLSSKRRVVTVKPEFGLGYWDYPPEVLVDFSKVEESDLRHSFSIKGKRPQDIPFQHCKFGIMFR